MARRSRRSDAVDAKPEAKGRACRMGVYARTSKSYDDGCSIANQQRMSRRPRGQAARRGGGGLLRRRRLHRDQPGPRRVPEDDRGPEGGEDRRHSGEGRQQARPRYVECQSFIREHAAVAWRAPHTRVGRGRQQDNAALDDFSIDMRVSSTTYTAGTSAGRSTRPSILSPARSPHPGQHPTGTCATRTTPPSDPRPDDRAHRPRYVRMKIAGKAEHRDISDGWKRPEAHRQRG